MKLVEDWREWKRWWSIRWVIASAFFSAIVVAYATLPADWLPEIDGHYKKWLSLGALITAGLSAVSRVVKQKPKDEQP